MSNSFRTLLQQSQVEYTISHQNPIMLMGSCFAESIGQKLTKYKFDALINPFGILFNPISIAQSLNRLTDSNFFQANDLYFHNDEWISFSHHGKFSHYDKEKCLDAINEKLIESRTFLQKTDFLILTLGTAVSYSYQGNVVANCHKVPQKEFQKQLFTVQDIISALTESIDKVRNINEKVRIIFTVSPVRYIKYDMVENTLSKSHLIVAAHELVSKISNCDYFPAYEIMMDDLRDYRFYCEDMIHPSQQAINYIWTAFYNKFFNDATLNLNMLIDEVVTAKNHQLKYPSSEMGMCFKKEQLKKIRKIQSLYPQVSLEEEIAYFLE